MLVCNEYKFLLSGSSFFEKTVSVCGIKSLHHVRQVRLDVTDDVIPTLLDEAKRAILSLKLTNFLIIQEQ